MTDWSTPFVVMSLDMILRSLEITTGFIGGSTTCEIKFRCAYPYLVTVIVQPLVLLDRLYNSCTGPSDSGTPGSGEYIENGKLSFLRNVML